MKTAPRPPHRVDPVVPAPTLGKARILLVDDHPLVREGLTVSINLTADLEVCGSMATASQALQAAATLRPDVAVLDLSLQGANGLDLLKDLRAQHPEVRVIVFSMHDELLYAEQVARAGARGYLTKNEPLERLVEAIRKVLRGALAFSEILVWRLHQEIANGKRTSDASPVARLTDREVAVLEALGRGRKSRQIASHLHVSVKTVRPTSNISRRSSNCRTSSACCASPCTGSTRPSRRSRTAPPARLTPRGAARVKVGQPRPRPRGRRRPQPTSTVPPAPLCQSATWRRWPTRWWSS